MQRLSISNINSEAKKYNSISKKSILLKKQNSIGSKIKLRTKTLESEKKTLSTHKLKKNSHLKTKQQSILKQRKQKNNINESEIKQVVQKVGKSRSPTYNQIKKKRLIRQQRSKTRLSKNNFNHAKKQGKIQQNILKQKQNKKTHLDIQISQVLKTKHFQKEQQKIKKYISQLQNVLINIKAEKQKTQRKSYTKFVQSNKKSILTERKEYEYNNDLLDVKKSLNFDYDNIPMNFKKTNNQKQKDDEVQNAKLITQIIDKNKKERKILNLKEIRDQYKQQLTVSKQKSIKKQYSDNQNETTKPFKTIPFIYTQNQTKNPQPVQIFSYKYGRKLTKTNNSISKTLQNKQINQQAKEGQNKQEIQIINEVSMKIEQTLNDNKQKQMEQQRKKEQQIDELRLSLQCSQIKQKKIQKDSFFSQIPSYMKQQRIQNYQQKKYLNHNKILTNNILQFVDLGQTQLKKIFKSKQKKRLVDLQKWKKNFPAGFFQTQK